MKTIYTEVLRDNAKRRVENAAEELRKGKDLNALETCMNCKLSMRQFLSAYLIDHGVEPGELQTIHLLMEKCKKVDTGFKNLDMGAIDCKYEELNDDHCTDPVHLQACLDTVKNIQNTVSMQA